MLCINENDNKGAPLKTKLYGHHYMTRHRSIELVFRPAPCNVKDCEEKLKNIKEYVNTPEMIMIFNVEHPNLDHYNNETIKRESKVINYQWSKNQNIFL